MAYLTETLTKAATKAAAVSVLALGLSAAPGLNGGDAHAAGKGVGVIDHDFAHEGAFGAFDPAQLRRGWQIYAEVCSSCHSLNYLSYRNLGEPGGPEFSEEDVKAIAAQFEVQTIDSEGEPIFRPAVPSDKMVAPYPNDEVAKLSNGGALPPDLSLMTKARTGYFGIWKQLAEGMGGPEYVYSLMLGYTDEPPEGFEVGDLYYNRYYPGHRIAMGRQLWEDFEYLDGTVGTVEQQAEDITAFLTWTAEPKMVERKQAGIRNLLFLTLFAVLLWYSNKKLWSSVKKPS
ncbi:MAG: cytochrome c1 [Pseudomonadota bacterium]